MRLGSMPKLDKGNKKTSIKYNYDVMSVHCDAIVNFPINGQFEAIRKPDSGYIVCRTFIFTNSNFLSYRNRKQTYKIFNTALILLL